MKSKIPTDVDLAQLTATYLKHGEAYERASESVKFALENRLKLAESALVGARHTWKEKRELAYWEQKERSQLKLCGGIAAVVVGAVFVPTTIGVFLLALGLLISQTYMNHISDNQQRIEAYEFQEKQWFVQWLSAGGTVRGFDAVRAYWDDIDDTAKTSRRSMLSWTKCLDTTTFP